MCTSRKLWRKHVHILSQEAREQSLRFIPETDILPFPDAGLPEATQVSVATSPIPRSSSFVSKMKELARQVSAINTQHHVCTCVHVCMCTCVGRSEYWTRDRVPSGSHTPASQEGQRATVVIGNSISDCLKSGSQSFIHCLQHMYNVYSPRQCS